MIALNHVLDHVKPLVRENVKVRANHHVKTIVLMDVHHVLEHVCLIVQMHVQHVQTVA